MQRSSSWWWRALVALPVLAAALVMHGLDGRVAAHAAAPAEASPDHHDSCPDCTAHRLLVACVAIAATVATAAAVRHLPARAGRQARAPRRAWVDRRDWFRAGMPPDPAWVRLCVMRC